MPEKCEPIIEWMRKIARGEIEPRDPFQEDPDREPSVVPLVRFSSEALDYLGEIDVRTKPGTVLSVIWCSGSSSYDPASDERTNHGSGLVLGWYDLDQIAPDQIVEYADLKLCFVFPPTDLAELTITLPENKDSWHQLVIDGPNPFED
ncbi:MAG: hypothetical protein AAFV19_17165 [Pseudomonadota bacterium]